MARNVWSELRLRSMRATDAGHAMHVVNSNGNQLVVIGDEGALKSGVSVLQALYNRLEQGKSILPVDVSTELRMNSAALGNEGGSEHLRMLGNNVAEIKTRKKLVEPRTRL